MSEDLAILIFKQAASGMQHLHVSQHQPVLFQAETP